MASLIDPPVLNLVESAEITTIHASGVARTDMIDDRIQIVFYHTHMNISGELEHVASGRLVIGFDPHQKNALVIQKAILEALSAKQPTPLQA